MPLSYFRRPLAMVTLSYIGFLSLLRTWGVFDYVLPREAYAFVRVPCVRLEGTVVSAITENRMGERVRVRSTRTPSVCRYDLDASGLERSHIGSFSEAADQRAGFATAQELLAYLPRHAPENAALRPGQRVALEGRLRFPRSPRHERDFNERRFLSDQGIALVFHARRLEILRARVPALWILAAWAQEVRSAMRRMFRNEYPLATAVILEGILLGSKGPLDSQTRRAVQDAGAMHLLVPSGTNVAILAASVLWLAPHLRLGRLGAYFLCAALCGFYGLVLGADPPFLRAYFCFLIAGVAHALGRESAGFQAMLISVWVILLAEPKVLFQPGFQMSYLTVLGLLIALPRWRLPGGWPVLWRGALKILMMSAVAQLVLLPILAKNFGRAPLVGAFSNVILVPLADLILVAGFAVWALYGVGATGPFQWTACLLGWCVNAFRWVCFTAAAAPAAAVNLRPLQSAELLAFYLAVFGVLILPAWRKSIVLFAVSAAVWVGYGVWSWPA